MKIEIKNLSYLINQKYSLFENISFTIEPASLINIYSKFPVGKSTLFKLIYLLEQPNSGEIIFNDKLSFPGIKKKQIRILKKNMSYMPPRHYFFENYSVEENLIVHCFNLKFKKTRIKHYLEHILYQTKLISLKNKFPRELSLSELQRLSFARALIGEPSLIVADQPFSNLDAENISYFQELVKKTNIKGISWIIASNYPFDFSVDLKKFELTAKGLKQTDDQSNR